jgi:hypothetical protein
LYATLPPIDVIYLRFGLLVWYVRNVRGASICLFRFGPATHTFF